MSKKLPLEGIRVVDVTLVWAGPHCTQLLAEWGAEVIRVEPRSRMQPSTRGTAAHITQAQVDRAKGTGSALFMSFPDNEAGERPYNRSPAFNSHARNKRSMTLDIMTPEGQEMFRRLIAESDVFVENNVPETIERANATYEELSKVNPKLIMLRMPGYGLDGPYKNYRTFGTHMEGMAGHHHIRSYPDLDPSMTGDSFTGDAAAGVQGAFAVMLALRQRKRTGKGQQIEMALAEGFIPYMGEFMMDYSMNGRITEPQGNRHRSHAPHNVYPCQGEDRWIVIDVGTPEEWSGLTEVMGDPDWASDPMFGDPVSRWQNQKELDSHITAWTRTQERYDLFHRLQNAGVPAGPVQNEADAYNCIHLNERGFFEELTSPDTGTRSYPGLIFGMSKTPNHLRRHPVALGEDNAYVYKEVMGLSDDQYTELENKGHIGTDYAPGVP